MRPNSIRMGGSNCFFAKPPSTSRRTHPPTNQPPVNTTTAPSKDGPCNRTKSKILSFHCISFLAGCLHVQILESMERNRRFGCPFGLQSSFLAILLLASCSTMPPDRQELQRFEFNEPQMGLPFRMVLYAPNKPAAEAAARAAFDRVRQLNGILSDYEDDSELSRLS